ncbi:AAA family ATPase [Sphingomonas sp. PsM26]|nr:AAA family ATPase [Sphingomonas sp. PsM26]
MDPTTLPEWDFIALFGHQRLRRHGGVERKARPYTSCLSKITDCRLCRHDKVRIRAEANLLVKRVQLKNHPGVGDVDVDFCDNEQNAYRSVVLAGGNGTGKTAILEAIQTVMEGRIGTRIGIIVLHLHFEDEELPALSVIFEKMGTSGDATAVCSNYRITLDTSAGDWSGAIFGYTDGDGVETFTTYTILTAEDWQKLLRSFYSEASVNFAGQTPQSITSNIVDNPSVKRARSGTSLAQEITQLLVDVRAADNEDLSKWVKGNPGVVVPNEITDIRFRRFADAFNYMFPTKRFKGVNTKSGLVIEFEEFGRVSAIDQLSTGEKQIVFRAGFLLRSLANLKGSIVLIDEPELSLHPEWQARIVSFYEKLLTVDGVHPQIIASTHSPFIVHGSIGAKTVILEKDVVTGRVSEMPKPIYPAIRGDEAVRAFNLDAFLADTTKPMLLLVEGRSDVELINAAWRKLRPDKARPFEARDFLGARNVTITLKDDTLCSRIGDRIVTGLYDFDDAFDQWHGVWKNQPRLGTGAEGLLKKHPSCQGYAMLLPIPPFRTGLASEDLAGKSAMSIEFLFSDAVHPPHLIEHTHLPFGQSVPKIKSSKKIEFAKYAAALSAAEFAGFEPLLARLEAIRSGNV